MADCYDQTTLEEFASSKDPAMVNAVEAPSAAMKTGTHSADVQRKEARSYQRNNVPVKMGNAHVTVDDSGQKHVGDNCREKGGTQKFLPNTIV